MIDPNILTYYFQKADDILSRIAIFIDIKLYGPMVSIEMALRFLVIYFEVGKLRHKQYYLRFGLLFFCFQIMISFPLKPKPDDILVPVNKYGE